MAGLGGLAGLLARHLPADPESYLVDADMLQVRFIGCGDAFGSGGRLQTCFSVESRSGRFLIDCGASSMVGLNAQGIDPDSVDLIVLTHFHGDHCGGVPFLLSHAVLASKRSRPLRIAGPAGTQQRITALWDLLFPGVSNRSRSFELEFIDIQPGTPAQVGAVRVSSWPALHVPETCPTLVRCDVGRKSIAYTGDTGWTDDLITASAGVDLLIAECYLDGARSPFHLGLPDMERLQRVSTARSIIATHASRQVLSKECKLRVRLASDGMVVNV